MSVMCELAGTGKKSHVRTSCDQLIKKDLRLQQPLHFDARSSAYKGLSLDSRWATFPVSIAGKDTDDDTAEKSMKVPIPMCMHILHVPDPVCAPKGNVPHAELSSTY